MPSPPATGKPRTPVTTPQVVEAVQVTRQTLNSWVKRGLLPAPKTLRLGRHGAVSEWPPFTVELALYVKAALNRRLSMQAVGQSLRPLLAQEPSWIEGRLSEGLTIEALVHELGGVT
jgi:hypothetical protein